MISDSERREIELALGAALARKGVGGRVVLRGSMAELSSQTPPLAIELGDWVEQWPLLPPDIRARKVDAAATRLAGVAPHRSGRVGRAARRAQGAWKKVLLAVVAVVLGGLAIRWLHRSNFFGPAGQEPAGPEATATPSQRAAAESPEERRARTGRVCEAARGRIRAGGTITGFDVDGWQVVVWLGRLDGGADWSRLDAQARDGSLERSAREAIGGITHGPATAGRDERLGGAAAQDGAPFELRLGADYVTAFLDVARRDRMIGYATSLGAQAGADAAALFAQCEHLGRHDMGAWYWGRDDAHAVAAILRVAGALAEPTGVALDRVAALGGWSAVVHAAGALRPTELAELVGAQGGVLQRSPTAAPADGTRVALPIGGPLRAQALARTLAQRLSLAVPAPGAIPEVGRP